MISILAIQTTGNFHSKKVMVTWHLAIWHNRPYAYDITEGRPRVLGVKRGTVTCAIAKHAASGPTPACHAYRRAGPGPRTDWEPTLFSTARARSATSLDPQHGVVVMEMWRQCIRSIALSDFRVKLSDFESQKGIRGIWSCSTENHKGTIWVLPYKLYGVSALLVLNGTSLNSNNALLVLS